MEFILLGCDKLITIQTPPSNATKFIQSNTQSLRRVSKRRILKY